MNDDRMLTLLKWFTQHAESSSNPITELARGRNDLMRNFHCENASIRKMIRTEVAKIDLLIMNLTTVSK